MGSDHGVQPEAKALPKTVGGHRCWDQGEKPPWKLSRQAEDGHVELCVAWDSVWGRDLTRGAGPGDRSVSGGF